MTNRRVPKGHDERITAPPVVTALPTVQGVEISRAAWGCWTWSYRLGNKTVWGPATRTKVGALCSLDAHLAERGLALPEEPSR
jgi:hypothetical protein